MPDPRDPGAPETRPLIQRRQPASDPFGQLTADSPLPADGDWLLGLDQLLGEDTMATAAEKLAAPDARAAAIATVTGRRGRTGIRITGDTDPTVLVPLLPHLAMVAIDIPKFSDGRAYSSAHLLRERLGFTGELRAVGHVLRDQLLYLERCGFDAFVLAPGQSVDSALKAFEELSVTYQPSSGGARRP